MIITPLIASTFRSDGGSMFGLVPKPIWSKLTPADERNRIAQSANVLLVELNDGRRGLIDTGCGSAHKFSDKERSLHGLGGGWPLEEALAARGTGLDAIDFVIFTHLHWDHAGGAGRPDGQGGIAPSFPRAVHIVHEQEWWDAVSGNPLLYKSYPAETLAPLRQMESRLQLISGADTEVLPGIRLIQSGGHTRGHCVVLIHDDPLRMDHPGSGAVPATSTLVFAGDVCPSRHHLRMVFQTAYDTFPLQTRAWKREWLKRIADERIMLCFDHDPETAAAVIRADTEREFAVMDILSTGQNATRTE